MSFLKKVEAGKMGGELDKLKKELNTQVQAWIDRNKLDYKIKQSDIVDEAISKVLYELQDLFNLTWD